MSVVYPGLIWKRVLPSTAAPDRGKSLNKGKLNSFPSGRRPFKQTKKNIAQRHCIETAPYFNQRDYDMIMTIRT